MNFTDARLGRFAAAAAIGIAVALPAAFKADNSGLSMLKSGDFPGFYVQAEILKRGMPEALYDRELQRSIENELWPSLHGSYNPAAYPPHTALLLRPLAAFDRQTAQIFFMAAMLFCYAASVRNLRGINRWPARRLVPVSVILVTFFPLFASLFGAQNAAASALLMTGAVALLISPDPGRNFAAGLLIGAWLFKPQYALLYFAGATVITRSFGMIAGFAAASAAVYAISALYFGAGWPSWWLNAVGPFDAQNLLVNRGETVSLRGVLTAFGAPYGFGWAATWIACAALLWALSVYRNSLSRAELFAVLSAAIPVVSPQTLFYDLTLSMFGYLMVADPFRQKTMWTLAAFIVAGAGALPLREAGVGAPFSVLSFAMLVVTCCEIFATGRKPHPGER